MLCFKLYTHKLYKNKKSINNHQIINASFTQSGSLGSKTATTRPDAYSNVCISLKINAISSFIVPWLTFWLTFIVNNQEWLVMK